MAVIGSTREKIRFAAFEVDIHTGQLRKHGKKIRLQQQPFKILALLLEHPDEIVTRDDLQKTIWPADTFVDFDVGLAAAIHKLRQALGDSADSPRFIETLPKRGYRFIAPVESVQEGDKDTSEPVPDVANLSPIPEPPQTQTPTGRIQSWHKVAAAIVLLALLLLGGWWAAHPRPLSYVIAVLPLKNLSAEPNTEYFSDALTDEIIRRLSFVNGLEVRSHTSSFVFKDKPRNIGEVGKALSADLVLEGTVLRSGERLRINVDLVRVSDDTPIWSERFDRQLADVVAIQDDISRSVVNDLRLKQIGGQRRYNLKFENYDRYLKAESMSMGPPDKAESVKQAIGLFEQVIATDPEFAPAYAGIAESYAHLRNPRGFSADALQQMRLRATQAIELDPLLAEGWATMGLVNASDLNWGDAERNFEQSIQWNPNLAGVRRDFATFVLLPEGKLDVAVQQMRKAASMDPLNPDVLGSLASILTIAGNYDEALPIARKRFESAPASFGGQVYGHALMLKGRYDEAIAVFQKQGGASRGYLAWVYAKTGRREEAVQIAAEKDVAQDRHQTLSYAGLGDADRVFDALNALAASNDVTADMYPSYPELAFVRHDPRMAEFRRKRGLSPLP
jgi:TolB-like protein/DNA-binding winged helix-turn-helix (wHTH) protein/Tfp pilus assembly protein PilF